MGESEDEADHAEEELRAKRRDEGLMLAHGPFLGMGDKRLRDARVNGRASLHARLPSFVRSGVDSQLAFGSELLGVAPTAMRAARGQPAKATGLWRPGMCVATLINVVFGVGQGVQEMQQVQLLRARMRPMRDRPEMGWWWCYCEDLTSVASQGVGPKAKVDVGQGPCIGCHRYDARPRMDAHHVREVD